LAFIAPLVDIWGLVIGFGLDLGVNNLKTDE
jgi:hypothetical protein